MSAARVTATVLLFGLGLPSMAWAEDPHPATVYVPLEAVEFTRACEVGRASAALRCGMFGDVILEPFTEDAEVQTAVVDAIRAALAPYAINVVTESPPVYLPHTILILSNHVVEDDDADSTTCTLTSPGLPCEALARDSAVAVVGAVTQPETMTTVCENPDVVTAALFGFGSVSGLEGSDAADDPMSFPPDWAAPKTAYQDVCGGLTVDAPICGPAHGVHCGDDPTRQNSHLELLAAYGAAGEPDTTPPTVADVEPADGSEFQAGAGSEIVMNATIADDSDIVGVRWTIAGEPLEKVDTRVPGTLTRCTNDVCDTNWGGRWIDRRASAQDWSFKTALAPGDYTITLDVSDLAGNTAQSVVSITVTDPPPGEDDSGGDGDDDLPPPFESDGTDSGESGDGDDDGGDSGCGCSARPGGDASWALLALPLLWRRRRARPIR